MKYESGSAVAKAMADKKRKRGRWAHLRTGSKSIDFSVKHVSFNGMMTMTIRDLRQHWPEAEKALQVEKEILITRDSKPVAKLVRVVEKKPRRKRWDPEKHKQWLKKMWGDEQVSLVDKYLQADREDRKL
jgi:antitoxin (DNA-binding transcriptional repressor) of toxin-antitoxin stability system